MKKIFNTLVICMLATCFIAAQSLEKEAKALQEKTVKSSDQAESMDGPQMQFEQMIMDYGEIDKGADPLRKFMFTNMGTEPLVIKNAKGSCGCTVPEYPKEPIMPGETGSIDVRYDTNRVGQFTKTVTLTTNMDEEKIVLTIKGKVNNVAEEESVPAKEGSIF